ncbi:hypothetical protein NEOKW01_2087 [Nematocida sp. AWRm80]|nr:hypothetical protein NEOKW01_2087 [Nematocida sp. AWRm80]
MRIIRIQSLFIVLLIGSILATYTSDIESLLEESAATIIHTPIANTNTDTYISPKDNRFMVQIIDYLKYLSKLNRKNLPTETISSLLDKLIRTSISLNTAFKNIIKIKKKPYDQKDILQEVKQANDRMASITTSIKTNYPQEPTQTSITDLLELPNTYMDILHQCIKDLLKKETYQMKPVLEPKTSNLLNELTSNYMFKTVNIMNYASPVDLVVKSLSTTPKEGMSAYRILEVNRVKYENQYIKSVQDSEQAIDLNNLTNSKINREWKYKQSKILLLNLVREDQLEDIDLIFLDEILKKRILFALSNNQYQQESNIIKTSTLSRITPIFYQLDSVKVAREQIYLDRENEIMLSKVRTYNIASDIIKGISQECSHFLCNTAYIECYSIISQLIPKQTEQTIPYTPEQPSTLVKTHQRKHTLLNPIIILQETTIKYNLQDLFNGDAWRNNPVYSHLRDLLSSKKIHPKIDKAALEDNISPEEQEDISISSEEQMNLLNLIIDLQVEGVLIPIISMCNSIEASESLLKDDSIETEEKELDQILKESINMIKICSSEDNPASHLISAWSSRLSSSNSESSSEVLPENLDDFKPYRHFKKIYGMSTVLKGLFTSLKNKALYAKQSASYRTRERANTATDTDVIAKFIKINQNNKHITELITVVFGDYSEVVVESLDLATLYAVDAICNIIYDSFTEYQSYSDVIEKIHPYVKECMDYVNTLQYQEPDRDEYDELKYIKIPYDNKERVQRKVKFKRDDSLEETVYFSDSDTSDKKLGIWDKAKNMVKTTLGLSKSDNSEPSKASDAKSSIRRPEARAYSADDSFGWDSEAGTTGLRTLTLEKPRENKQEPARGPSSQPCKKGSSKDSKAISSSLGTRSTRRAKTPFHKSKQKGIMPLKNISNLLHKSVTCMMSDTLLYLEERVSHPIRKDTQKEIVDNQWWLMADTISILKEIGYSYDVYKKIQMLFITTKSSNDVKAQLRS